MRYLVLCVAILLAGCGTLPEPFYGDPGTEGAKLATPPAPVLKVPPPDNALLANDSAKLYADDLATALVGADVPSIAGPAGKTDWRVITAARLDGGNVIPTYKILGPDGKTYGTQEGAPVAAADWANGDPAALNKAAAADALTLSNLLAKVNAQVQGSNPNSLENRPPRVFFSGVTGAPGDGDTSLALNMNRDLPGLGVTMVKSLLLADFTLAGIVSTKPDTGGQIEVTINWLLKDQTNRTIGQITQLHDVNPSDIDPYWGDVAAAAADEAAGGIHEAIANATLKKVSR